MPEIGSFGNAARTVFRGPDVNNWDMALFKDFPIRERMTLQLRCETCNTFNHTQFTGADTSARFDPRTGEQVDPQFGQMTSAADGRIIQLAVQFLF